jgi:hypothetical protein
MDFSKLFPWATTWVESLPQMWPFLYLQNIYAPFGAIHLVGMALLGGCVLLINLRLLNAGATSETPASVERNLRPWQLLGAAIVLGTGIVIGALNSAKLFYSTAFLAKMIAMAAALLFTFGVCNSVARSDGQVSGRARIIAAIAIVLWLVSMWIFSTTNGLNPGVFHVVTGAFAILLFLGGLSRIAALVSFGALVLGFWIVYAVVGFDNGDQIYQDLSKWGVAIASIVIAVFLGLQVSRAGSDAPGPFARAIAVFSILSWITVAAGGRWIGFS